MRTLAMIARADDGGIGAQSWQFARRMKPERILIVHTEHEGRGAAQPDRYRFDYGPEILCAERAPRRRHAEWLLSGMQSVFTIECWYGLEVLHQARGAGIKTVCQSNPEMSGFGEDADVIWAPTDWRLDALPPKTKVMPFPTDLELLQVREPTPPKKGEPWHIYHVHSPAMCDRNGTELLLEAIGQVRHHTKLMIRGGHKRTEHRGLATVEWLGHHDGMFFEHWPYPIDLFVLPRRFGGLCLPMQEAATIGLPIITLDVSPQRSRLPLSAMVPARVESEQGMRGGRFEVHTCNPQALAAKINEVIENEKLRMQLANASWEWATAISWEKMQPLYEAVLR